MRPPTRDPALPRWTRLPAPALPLALLAAFALFLGACGDDGTNFLGLETGTLVVEVLLQDGTPVAGAEITATLVEEGGSEQRSRITGTDGRARIEEASEGSWSVEVVFPSGFTAAPSTSLPASVTVRGGEEAVLRIEAAAV